ncbi:ribosomal protein, putative [Ichthyophthirius multifiliis]|uniref:Ribosomal protein, putative n=1 Tax=Ichthyophthirius multifiliis TaxID=5932 RepID=G0QSW4_ICHMU|nr:ribosomal protein, putative [Ichthyophthirius multifiliis]EGR31697.1 ribosomal protein, putative [Ichthyophthirius multifiliis]|eukprot:XP_004035183.1 ribosomal protein, putative [Ichthyophthirius multifiliis]
MSSVWNLLNPVRNGGQTLKLLDSGREFFGTVIKHGINDKTVTVRVDHKFWVPKYKEYQSSQKKYQVHDEENFCVIGDKVVIRSCMPLSPTKHYFVRNIVKPFSRDEFKPQKDQKKELDENVKQEYEKVYKELLEGERIRLSTKKRKEELIIKAQLKARALQKAIAIKKSFHLEKNI